MKLHRIYALVVRHYFSLIHNFDRFSDVFYWPAIDMLVWGLMSTYITSNSPKGINFLVIILSSLVFWTITWRVPYEVAITVLDDLWSKNLINIFVSPLTFIDWFISMIVVSATKGLVSFMWSGILAFFLYRVGILNLGPSAFAFVACLLFTGWTVGLLISSLILRFGMKVQAFGWTLGAVIMPFSAIYYPLTFLPKWAQVVAMFIPSSYVFESIRQLSLNHTVSVEKIFISFGLNLIYISIAIFSIWRGYKGMLKRGINSYY